MQNWILVIGKLIDGTGEQESWRIFGTRMEKGRK
jgi:hypothetical protein